MHKFLITVTHYNTLYYNNQCFENNFEFRFKRKCIIANDYFWFSVRRLFELVLWFYNILLHEYLQYYVMCEFSVGNVSKLIINNLEYVFRFPVIKKKKTMECMKCN